jgi:hypothetical protein
VAISWVAYQGVNAHFAQVCLVTASPVSIGSVEVLVRHFSLTLQSRPCLRYVNVYCVRSGALSCAPDFAVVVNMKSLDKAGRFQPWHSSAAAFADQPLSHALTLDYLFTPCSIILLRTNSKCVLLKSQKVVHRNSYISLTNRSTQKDRMLNHQAAPSLLGLDTYILAYQKQSPSHPDSHKV